MKVCLIFFLAFSFLATAAEQYGIYDAYGKLISTFEAESYELIEKVQQSKSAQQSKILYVSSLSKNKNSKPTSRYRYKAETGAYIEASRKETFSLCPDKEIQGTWISEYSVYLNAENCLSVQTPNLAGTIRILFMENSGRTDTIQVLVEQSYIQMGDYSHKIWKTDLDYEKVTNLGYLLVPWRSWEDVFSKGRYESKNYNQPLIVDKTKLTMGDALYYNKIDTSIIVHWTFKEKEYKNEKLEESNLPLIGVYNYDRKIANERSKKEGLDTAYIIVKPNSEEAQKFILLGNPLADYHTCESCTMLALDTSASGYRSPFEEEWMLLMRAGTSTRYYWGDNSDSRTVSRYEWISPLGLKPVAQLLPNEFGLYDMIGVTYETVISDFFKDWWDIGTCCDHNLSPECIYMEEISPEENYNKRTRKVFYQGFRLIRKTPKLHKLEKF